MDDMLNRAEKKRIDEQNKRRQKLEAEKIKSQNLRIAAEAAEAVAKEKIRNMEISSPKPSWVLKAALGEFLAGDKMILPATILADIEASRGAIFPLIFEVFSGGKKTHAGVLEFSSDEIAILPVKVFLNLKNPTEIGFNLAHLEKATFLELHAFSSRVYDFPDFRNLLENRLSKNYTALTIGDKLLIEDIPLVVASILPAPAACLIDTNVTLNLVVRADPANERRLGVLLEEDAPVRIDSPAELTRFRINCNSGEISIKLKYEPANAQVDFFAAAPPASEASPAVFDKVGEFNLEKPGASEIKMINQGIIFLCVSTKDAEFFSIEFNREKAKVIENPEFSQKCENCLKAIPVESFAIHELSCARQVFRCPVCDLCIRKNLESFHAHCRKCQRAIRSDQQERHDQLWHSEITCLCGEAQPDRAALERHRAGECRKRLVVCRFCGLPEEVGDLRKMDAKDRFEGLNTEHEGLCGNRTQGCEICGKILRLKDLPIHFKIAHKL